VTDGQTDGQTDRIAMAKTRYSSSCCRAQKKTVEFYMLICCFLPDLSSASGLRCQTPAAALPLNPAKKHRIPRTFKLACTFYLVSFLLPRDARRLWHRAGFLRWRDFLVNVFLVIFLVGGSFQTLPASQTTLKATSRST